MGKVIVLFSPLLLTENILLREVSDKVFTQDMVLYLSNSITNLGMMVLLLLAGCDATGGCSAPTLWHCHPSASSMRPSDQRLRPHQRFLIKASWITSLLPGSLKNQPWLELNVLMYRFWSTRESWAQATGTVMPQTDVGGDKEGHWHLLVCSARLAGKKTFQDRLPRGQLRTSGSQLHQ